MRIQIVSKREGFRRCGIAHPAAPVVYAGDEFTAQQLRLLKSEPMLVVVELPDEPEAKGKAKGKGDAKADEAGEGESKK